MEEKTQNSRQGAVGEKKNIGMAIVAYILFFIPLLTDSKNDPFVKFHVRQGLVLFVGYIIAAVLSPVFFVGWIINICVLILFVLGVLNAIGGKEAPLPFIGQFAEKIKI